MKEIELTKGYVALVDDEDYERVNQYNWCASISQRKGGPIENVYALRSFLEQDGTWVEKRMHVFIMGTKGIDHWDGNGLNNQRYNLRVATNAQNNWNKKLTRGNTSGYKGIYWHKTTKKWQASIKVNKKHIYLGEFLLAEDAARAYDAAALKYHGEFAMTNVMLGLLSPLKG